MKSQFYQLKEALTFKFIFLLFITQCLIKGIVFVIFTSGIFPLLKEMNIDAVHVQIYGAIAMSPWTLKPLIGILSDLIAFNGLHKRWWMLFSVIIGIVGAIMMVVDIRNVILIVIFF